ncbi:MAG: VWA domain-containing protein, partial [Candidatus Heimdallarchaeota archaeon]|nr:VWA domain-containing protein [Candidatus Heimdallarchaeota archaeon]
MRKRNMITVFIFTLFLTSLCMNFAKSEAKVNTTDDVAVIEAKEDLVITLETNATTIGKCGGTLVNLTLDNQGTNPASSIQVDFGLDGEYAEFSPTYLVQQNVPLLNPGSSVILNIEAILNSSLTGGELFDSADVCLVFDSSGSMGEEINSVKVEFLAMTNRLTQTISSLRMGMIVYGWSEYSEYPTANPNNYIEFTDDFNAINDLINELTPDGGTEPWGDALYLANTWDWREEVPKLLIIVGDEDCDPGHVVGVGSSDPYYNGSQLLDVVTNLKEK